MCTQVSSVAVDLDSGKVEVGVKAADQIAALEALPALVAAVQAAGFDAEPLIE